MGKEIERKYLVDKDKWENAAKGEQHHYRQGYMLAEPDKTIRIRIADNKGFITIKGISVGAARPEYEYAIPQRDAEELLNNFCNSAVSKIRYRVVYKGKLWEVDDFLDDNAGLLVAEIELTDEAETFDLPDWIDREVTGDNKYYNSDLSVMPFKNWKD